MKRPRLRRFGFPPDLLDADAMNAAILIVEALRASGGDANACVVDFRHGRHGI